MRMYIEGEREGGREEGWWEWEWEWTVDGGRTEVMASWRVGFGFALDAPNIRFIVFF